MNQAAKRKDMLKRVRQAIREHKFTARELSVPTEADVILVLLSIDEFPYKMPYTKLAIICFIGSRGAACREDLMNLLSKDYTTIAHNLIDLVQYGYIHEDIIPTGKKKIRRRTYTLTDEGKRVFEEFVVFYQQKIIETSNLFNAVDSADIEDDVPCALATQQPPELPL